MKLRITGDVAAILDAAVLIWNLDIWAEFVDDRTVQTIEVNLRVLPAVTV